MAAGREAGREIDQSRVIQDFARKGTPALRNLLVVSYHLGNSELGLGGTTH